MSTLIELKNISIQNQRTTVLPALDWKLQEGEAWLVIGPNGGGKADFVKALSGRLSFCQNDSDSILKNEFAGSVGVVSLEEAASLIEEERSRDETDYMDREDQGRTGRAYIAEVLGGSSKKNAPLPEIAYKLETMPQVKLCGVEKILDRGLRYMSTGEIRRTLLCRALLSDCKLLVLSDPFAGLDAESRRILLEFFDSITKHKNGPVIILCMERFTEIPDSINRVLEFSDKKVSYCGNRSEYENLLAQRNAANAAAYENQKKEFIAKLDAIRKDYRYLENQDEPWDMSVPYISFNNVNVGWDDHKVLINMNWNIFPGCHWLIRGPNGCGKTTILELITGDNMQVFREDIKIFGNRRGSGETIWDIKKHLGIVSYRLHVEYRMVSGTTLENVIISGFHDSIGLYQEPTDYEKAVARAWLDLAGLADKKDQMFSQLSYGEQRAVLILRAAVKNPRILILDEPCHGLDEGFRVKILDLLEKIGSTGTTTLLHVTHDPTEVLACETNILELTPGESPRVL